MTHEPTDAMVEAAQAEYDRWANGSDSRRENTCRFQVLRLDGEAYDEISAYASRVEAESAMLAERMQAVLRAAFALLPDAAAIRADERERCLKLIFKSDVVMASGTSWRDGYTQARTEIFSALRAIPTPSSSGEPEAREPTAVEVLRELEWGDNHLGNACCPSCHMPPARDHTPDCRLAKALASEQTQGDRVAELENKAEQWRWTAHDSAKAADDSARRIATLERQNAELREALEPISKFAVFQVGTDYRSDNDIVTTVRGRGITGSMFGHLRRARAALAKGQDR